MIITVFHRALLGAVITAMLYGAHWLITGDFMEPMAAVAISSILSMTFDILMYGRAMRETRHLSALYDLPPHQR